MTAKERRIGDWLVVLKKHEHVFAAQRLQKGLEYLKSSRNLHAGWGLYPRLDSDLHSTALAISALSLDSMAKGVAADSIAYVRREHCRPVAELSYDDICDLLIVLSVEDADDDAKTKEALTGALSQKWTIATSMSGGVRAKGVLAALSAGAANDAKVREAVEQIVRSQNPDGGWSAVPQDSSAVVSTALSMRALSRVQTSITQDSLQKGIYFLQRQLESRGWAGLSPPDSFVAATVLMALAEGAAADYRWIRDGIDTIHGRQNEDGGWGSVAGEPSNLELTALCLLALAAAGENRFVPSRLAEAELTNAHLALSEIAEEHERLKADFAKRVQEDCGRIVAQRDKLLVEQSSLKKRLEVATAELQSTRREAEAVLLRYRMFERQAEYEGPDASYYELTEALETKPWYLHGPPRLLLLFSPLVILGVVIFLLWQWPMPVTKLLTLVMFFATTVGFTFLLNQLNKSYSRNSALAYGLQHRRRRRALLEDGSESSEVGELRAVFMDAASSVPASVREELIYRLMHVVDMPPDVGDRFADDLFGRLDLPQYARRQLSMWIRAVLRLEQSDRRVLLAQLQHAVLR